MKKYRKQIFLIGLAFVLVMGMFLPAAAAPVSDEGTGSNGWQNAAAPLSDAGTGNTDQKNASAPDSRQGEIMQKQTADDTDSRQGEIMQKQTADDTDPGQDVITPELGADGADAGSQNGADTGSQNEADAGSQNGQEPEVRHPFKDVSEGQWFAAAVQYVFSRSLMKGMDQEVFEPGGSVSRGMVVTVIYRMAQSPACDEKLPFTDVETGRYYTEAIRWAAAKGIVDGYGNGLFGPADSISREQLAKMLFGYAESKGYDLGKAAESLDRFTDADAVSRWAESAMKWAVGAGLFQGDTEGCLSPGDTLTRGQMAQVLQRTDEKIEALKADNNDPDDPDKPDPDDPNKPDPDDPDKPNPDDPPESILTAPSGSRSFADNMTRQMTADSNWTLSPYSLEMCLAMLTNGAKGATREELMNTLRIKDLDEYNAGVKELLEKYDTFKGIMSLETANAMWLNQDAFGGQGRFLDSFSEALQLNFRAETREVHTADAGAQINQWAKEKTHGKIEKVIDSEEWNFTTALSNAVYFKAGWADPFGEEGTFEQTFHSADGTEAEIPFMHQQELYGYYENNDVQAVRLNYRKFALDPKTGRPTDYNADADFSMYFVLSENDVDLQHFLDQAKFEGQQVRVSIPKFKIEYGGNLNEMLQALGITTAFEPTGADLTGMVSRELLGGQNLFLDTVIQKAFIQIDEEGTEAAAVTVATEATTAVPPDVVKEFTADRPFWFAIRDNRTGRLLFTGRFAQAG